MKTTGRQVRQMRRSKQQARDVITIPGAVSLKALLEDFAAEDEAARIAALFDDSEQEQEKTDEQD